MINPLSKLVLPPIPQLMRHPNGTSLLRTPGGALAGSSACCCDEGPPLTTCGSQSLSGCFTDLLALYPDNSGPVVAAFLAYLATVEFDIGINGGFTGSCGDSSGHDGFNHCDVAGNGPYVVEWVGGRWETVADQCPDRYSLGLRFSMACAVVSGVRQCNAVLQANFGAPGFFPIWGYSTEWRKVYFTERTFAGVSDTLPFNVAGNTGTGSDPDNLHPCSHDGTSTASYAMH